MTDTANQLIEAAATAVADALLALDEANDALKPAAAHREVVVNRIEALETERAAILAARRTGHQDDAVHGPRLFLLDADLTDLKVLLAEADAQLAPLRQAAEEARRQVSAATTAQDNVREGEVLRLTIARADELGALLLRAIGEIDVHKRRLGASRNLYTPAKQLADTLHRLDLQRIPEVSKC
jgi:hypothetical protein